MTQRIDPLPSWHEGRAKARILRFIAQVTDPQSDDYVAPEDRIATFDNDGTLWVEKPILAQLAFYKRQLLNADVINSSNGWLRFLSWVKHGVLNFFDLLRMAKAYIHAGLTTDEYREKVADWIAKAEHPRYKKKYTELTYQPMMELMALLNEHGFSNYIVSGGTSNFLRPWTEQVYGITMNRIIGSSVRTRLCKKNGELAVKLEPVPFFFDYRSGKVLGIERALAKRPIAAFGNSLGDVEMLRWTRTTKQSLCMLIHHTDDVREYKYSPDPFYYFGKPTLSWAQECNWQVVDMKNDWKRVFKFESLE